MKIERSLIVNETFLTLQGEGPSTGKPAYFVRLGTCNQHCSWCDTPYTWAFDERHAALHRSGKKYDPIVELKRVRIRELSEHILAALAPLCVITGGEPLLQREVLAELISLVNESVRAPEFEIETAGTVSPRPLRDYENVSYNVSPKLASSGNPLDLRYRPDILDEFVAAGARFKFVVNTTEPQRTRADLAEVTAIVNTLGIPPDSIWLMPEGTNAGKIERGLALLARPAIENRWNLSGRMHITIWGDERGR